MSDEVQELFCCHYLALVRLAMRLVDDQESAEDLVQDVFAGLGRGVVPPDDAYAYLRTAVLNRARSALRRRRVARMFQWTRRVHVEEEPAEAHTLRAAERARMLAAIRSLPHRQREAVVLHYYEDLPVAEIATVLDTSPGAISSALHPARATLASVIDGEDHHAD